MTQATHNPQQREPIGQSIRRALFAAAVVGLSAAFVDLIVGILDNPLRFEFFTSIFPVLAIMAAVVSAAYVILWLVAVFPLQRILRVDPVASACALGCFLAAFLWLPQLLFSERVAAGQGDLSALLVTLIGSGLAALALYAAVRARRGRGDDPRRPAAWTASMPFILAESALLVWLMAARGERRSWVIGLLACALYVLAVLLTLVVLLRLRGRSTGSVAVTVLLVLVMLLPFIMRMADSPIERPGEPAERPTAAKGVVPHVVLISIDTLRADALSCYQPGAPQTPTIDAFAADGILFERAYSTSGWTLPAMASVMTGMANDVHGAVAPTLRLPDALPTLAECMREARYATAAIGSSRMLSPSANLVQGFQHYDFFPKLMARRSIGDNLLAHLRLRRVPYRVSTRELTGRVIAWLEQNHNEDFFLWVHYYDPHMPYDPPAEYLTQASPPTVIGTRFAEPLSRVRSGHWRLTGAERRWIRRLYDAEVRYVDDNVGRLMAALKRLKLYDDALIILTSDHGEEFWEHGSFEHGHTLYNELLWVPLIVKPPAHARPMRIPQRACIQDIMWMVLDVCGVAYLGEIVAGPTLADLWSPDAGDIRMPPIFSSSEEYFEPMESVIAGDHKYIRRLTSGREELYDLSADPQEWYCIGDGSNDVLQTARSLLNGHAGRSRELREHFGLSHTEARQLDSDTLRALRALGYVE